MVQKVYLCDSDSISELAQNSTNAILNYFGISLCRTIHSSEMHIPGEKWERVLAIVKNLGGNVYLTGHGARFYLNHEEFEKEGVQVMYMDYQKYPYSQLHGEFTPYVSALDLIANCGTSGRDVIGSGSITWRDFINGNV